MFPVAVSVPPGVPFDPAPLAGLGLAPTPFPADGDGGRELEAAVKAGRFAGVLELWLSEVAAQVANNGCRAGPDRLTAAGLAGVPQVITVRGSNWVMLDGNHYSAGSFASRTNTVFGDWTGGRVTPEEADRIGQDIAQKACAARGPTVIILPLAGLAVRWTERDREADAALFQSIRNWVYGVEIIELDLAADDPLFVRAAAERLAAMLTR